MSNFIIRFFFIFIINLAMGFQVFCQVNDFQSWNIISLEKKINKKTSLLLDQEFRFQNNATQFQNYITVIGADYSINKYIKVRGLYRFTYSTSLEDGIENEHLFYADLMLRYKTNRFTFGYRARYQLAFQYFNVNTFRHFRNKFTVKYDLPKTSLTPFAEYEFYYILNNPVQNTIDRNRYTLGLDYPILNYLSVYSFYCIQIRREYYRVPVNKYILGLGVNIII